MMISYPARIRYDRADQSYLVDFPDLPGCHTFGESKEEALAMAQEVLTLFLESLDSRKRKIPRPSSLKGRGIHYIKPEKSVAFAIWLRFQRESKGLTQQDVARRLGVSYQTYQRFEDPVKSNPTLRTIQKLEAVFGEDLIAV